MKANSFALILALLLSAAVSAQEKTFVDARTLNIEGQFFENLPNVWHRIDTSLYKGFKEKEQRQMLYSAGKMVFFRTDSRSISVRPTYGIRTTPMPAVMDIAIVGFDLYINEDDGWRWAGMAWPDRREETSVRGVKSKMKPGMKECMIYCPLFSELLSLEIGVDEGSVIEPLETPFRHRILFHGSSFTHGYSCSRPGMAYPYQFMRKTGLLALNLGCSGNCKMQPYYTDFLEDIEADAYVFDAFSNPSAALIQKRLPEFVDRMVKAHPGKPIIFQQTIYREGRAYNQDTDRAEQRKMDVARELMNELCARYPDVYFIVPNAADDSHDTTVDGTHPNDYGYGIWAESIRKPLLKILKKYGIK